MAKAEQSIINFKEEMEKHQIIIRQFDENLATKCNKADFDMLNTKLCEDFVT